MKRLFLFLISMLFFFNGCSDNPTEPLMRSDSELKSKIVGTWASTFITITYNEDGSFFETVNYIVYSDSSTTPPEAIEGSYTIKDGILNYVVSDWKRFNDINKTLSKSDWTSVGLISNDIAERTLGQYSDNEISPIAYLPDYKIQFQDDLLYFHPLSILTSTGTNNDNIWGDWSTMYWGLGIDHRDSLVLGELELQYKFDKSTSTVTYGSKFLSDSLGTFNYQTDSVEYNSPNLTWGKNIYNKNIEFHSGKMYMFENLISQIPLKKIR